MEKRSLSERLFDGSLAEGELEEQLIDAGVEIGGIRWDHYDNSLELDGVPNDLRLSKEQQKIIHAAGFGRAYVNHQDKWETHYVWGHDAFKEVEGWRSNSKVDKDAN